MTLLHPGDRFPALTVALPGDGALRLPDALADHYGMVLFYRGSWCRTVTPSCTRSSARWTTSPTLTSWSAVGR